MSVNLNMRSAADALNHAEASFQHRTDAEADADCSSRSTLRFDIHLAHIGPMLAAGQVKKEDIVRKVREAILQAVDDSVGTGLDGVAIPGGAMIIPTPKTELLHRESVCFNLS